MASGNGLVVVTLYDENGGVAGYAAGTPDEVAGLAESVWSESADPGNAVDVLKGHMANLVQEARQDAEALGVMVNGNIHSTDISSQVKYVGILVYAALNRDYVGTWKTMNNGFITLDAAGVSVMCACVMAYIQVCFSWEQYIMSLIEAATTVPELQAIDFMASKPAGQLPPYLVAGLEAAGGAFGSGALLGTSMTTSGIASAVKFKGGSTTPDIAGGAGAGTTAVVSLTSGSTDSAGQISVVSSGTIDTTSGAVIATVTFSAEYATVPFVVITGANLAAGSIENMPFVSASTTGFDICVSNNAGLSTTTHLFNYVVMQ
jgi:Domain of unknown function (DUF4376)